MPDDNGDYTVGDYVRMNRNKGRMAWWGWIIIVVLLVWNFAPLACDLEADDYEDATDACWNWEKGL